MSDKILQALMQLFAIVANTERFSAGGRAIVENFLSQQINQASIDHYLSVFDNYRGFLQGKTEHGKAEKRLSVNSVKILKICTDINKELEQKQKYVVLIRLMEFVAALEGEVSRQELDFIETVAEVFHISRDEYNYCLMLVNASAEENLPAGNAFLLIDSKDQTENSSRTLLHDSLSGRFWVLYISSANILFLKYLGSDSLQLNGQALVPGKVYVLSTGSVIRGPKMKPVYYSDVMRSYLMEDRKGGISFQASDIEYKFSNGNYGLRRTNFSAASGDLIGIMGGSGAGKSTLLNILNSNLTPAKGKVLINGIDLHGGSSKLDGVIGHVPQDDLLMEDLTVFQNLFYNTKLCFGSLSDKEISVKVNEQLEVLGLLQVKDLKVGSSLDKTISGGQRKRLNIALELIRKPMILFVDEPTSGLSSLDSEHVMDLLKQLSLSGKLVFIVIHQPSSTVFKLFDKLLILDIGGYPIYFGNPSDALIYFKHKANFVDADISDCPTCGNVNAEQIFSIVEARVMDEYGQPGTARKYLPEEWYRYFNDSGSNKNIEGGVVEEDLSSGFKKPSRLRQLSVFMARDVFSKLRNTQYLLINFLEAPLLALILAFVLRYYNSGENYIFRENMNLPAFIFISVLVAVFMGLTVSAEEIIRDRKILKREAFLRLSHSSYLISKMLVLFLISAIQTFSYVIIANLVFGIRDMLGTYWLILFSVSCFSNVAGLNISASFKSVVTIYILIPFLIIPQIILSGVIVKFENLNPKVTSQSVVPWVGELMTTRWAFEALAVEQFRSNEYERHFFEVNKKLSNATYKKDFWLIKVEDVIKGLEDKDAVANRENEISLLRSELSKEMRTNNSVTGSIDPASMTSAEALDFKGLNDYTAALRRHYIDVYNQNTRQKDQIVSKLKTKYGSDGLLQLKQEHANKNLRDLVLNSSDFNPIVRHENSFVRRFRPIYMQGSESSFIRAPLYVSKKNVFGNYINTYWINLFVIWIFSLILMVTLYFDLLGRSIKFLDISSGILQRRNSK